MVGTDARRQHNHEILLVCQARALGRRAGPFSREAAERDARTTKVLIAAIITGLDKPYKFTRSSRNHRIGRASAKHVMTHTEPDTDTDESGATIYSWTGLDERGRELEIVAVDRPDCVLVFHVMPTQLRERK